VSVDGLVAKLGDEAAVALLIIEQCGPQVVSAEIGPERGRNVNLGVGNLPQQEVRYAQFARGAN